MICLHPRHPKSGGDCIDHFERLVYCDLPTTDRNYSEVIQQVVDLIFHTKSDIML